MALWLPVESLLRFRSLSKSLCAFIDSSDFINSHLCKSSSQNFNLRKLIFQEPYREKFHVYLEQEESLALHKPVSSISLLWNQVLWQEVFGYCKGLLLLYRNSLRPTELALALWNPSTRQLRDLPDCPLDSPDFVETYRITGCGLGYDDSTDDYKAFFILDVFHKFVPKLEVQVWIYSLKSNDWSRSHNFPCPDYKIDTDPGIAGIGYFTTDGTLHWLCTLFSNPWKSEIVSFDMRTETFSVLHLPVCSVDEVSSQLHVLEGCLCVSLFSGRYLSLFGRGSTMPAQADLYYEKEE